MRSLSILLPLAALLGLSSIAAAADSKQWSFTGAKLIISKRGDATPLLSKEFTPSKPIDSKLKLSHGEVLKLSMTFLGGEEPAVPHQAYLLVKQSDTGLETFFPLDTHASTAKAKLEVAEKDIPAAFIASNSSLELSLVVGDFTPHIKPILTPVGTLQLDYEATARTAAGKAIGSVVKYEKLPELRHTFREDPKNPPKIITLVFLGLVVQSLAGLFIVWALIGANLSALPKALSSAPISHPVFFASLIALEAVFFKYYTGWNLFKTLAGVLVVGPVAFLSGSRALREVQARRLNGER
ncbi:Oligosaccharyltransferase subunit Ribophorin II-domain-containing protein [Peziza echinospora]|nr:Oligosaccharyltransferase subunit Ribophorin II-domain-containing protein [Peziza echinospora]